MAYGKPAISTITIRSRGPKLCVAKILIAELGTLICRLRLMYQATKPTKAAAKMSPLISWAVASNKQLPIDSGSVDLVLCMFGFPVWSSFSKVLKKAGHVLLVDASEDHLIELREIIYPTVTKSGPPSMESAFKSGYQLQSEESLRFKIELNSQAEINDLLSMTPHVHRMTEEGKRRLALVEKLQLTVDLSVRTLGLTSG